MEFDTDERFRVPFGRAANIDITPRILLPDAIGEALELGLVAFKYTLTGDPPQGSRQEPGEYVVAVDFVGGRWLGRVIDGRARVRCVIAGIEMKQLALFHGRGQREVPRVRTHPIAPSGFAAAAQDWAEVQLDWQPFGAGCWSTIICVPGAGT